MASQITFERIGRNHHVPPLLTNASTADEIAAAVHRYARPHLRSRHYDVTVDLEACSGWISCGFYSAGKFKIQGGGT